MQSLPDSIKAIGYRSTSGELAWRRSDVPAALAEIASAGFAVLGGEVWIALGDGRWHGLVPDRHGGPPSVWHWETTPRAAKETWRVYCQRVADESAQAVAAIRVEEESHRSVLDKLFFNLTFVSEGEAEQ